MEYIMFMFFNVFLLIVVDYSVVFDDVYLGDICGVFGMILYYDIGICGMWWVCLCMLFVIIGLGLIVMVGDNDVGVFGIYM